LLDIVFVLLVVFLAYKNNLLAKRKGQNSIVWVFITILAFFIGEIIGGMIMLLLFYKGEYTIEGLQAFMTNPVRMLILPAAGMGGYLLIRYILERMPDVKQDNL
jgi:hypothetical protein